jgi:pyridoxamine 5'-phosphate oxidase
MTSHIADLRRDYTLHGLLEEESSADPFVLFGSWFDAALSAGVTEPNAMTLATVSATGRPAARVVLLKGVSQGGFVLYTNYLSRKGRELEQTPWASLVFLWQQLERQVRVEGRVEKVSDDESDAYFQSRPRSSQIGAWASDQSEPIGDRFALAVREQEFVARFGDGPIPRPSHWGGYRVVADRVEFWQGRTSRLHDRLAYSLSPDGSWSRQRLSP